MIDRSTNKVKAAQHTPTRGQKKKTLGRQTSRVNGPIVPINPGSCGTISTKTDTTAVLSSLGQGRPAVIPTTSSRQQPRGPVLNFYLVTKQTQALVQSAHQAFARNEKGNRKGDGSRTCPRNRRSKERSTFGSCPTLAYKLLIRCNTAGPRPCFPCTP